MAKSNQLTPLSFKGLISIRDCGCGISFDRICVSVLFVLLTYKVHFWCAGTSLEYVGWVCISRSMGQGQGHRCKKRDIQV